MAANQFVEFQAYGAAEDAFEVGRVQAVDELSALYRYEVELFSATPDHKFDDLMAKTARIGLKQTVVTGDGSKGTKLYNIYGMLASFEQLEKHSDLVRYRAAVVPRVWKLGQTFQSRIFQNLGVVDIVDEVLKDSKSYKLKEKDDYGFDGATRANYKPREYVVQYQESDLAFVSRWLEHEGLTYAFEMKDGRERIVLFDKTDSYADLGVKLKYRPGGEKVSKGEAGFGDAPDEEVVRAFVCRRRPGPAKVQLADWNWREPDVKIAAEAVVSDTGQGMVYEYGNHYRTQEEGKALAAVRAGAIKCRLTTFEGVGNCRSLRPGGVFELQEHYRKEFDGKYLVTSVRHSMTQPVGLAGAGTGGAPKYENTFTCIPASVLFRPERLTPWPRVSGFTPALVDGEAAEKYGPLDDQGQYRLKMLFDLSDKKDGKASRPVRMAQPSAGSGYGVHFPQHLKTEVLVAHNEGNPDRPVIVGAVPNPKTPTPVKGGNKSQLIFKSSGNNMLLFDDKEGEQMVFLHAEKALDVRAKGNVREFAGAERHVIVEKKKSEHDKDDVHLVVDGEYKVDLGKSYHVSLKTDHNVQVGGDFSVKSKGVSIEASSGFFVKAGTIHLKAGTIVIEGDSEVTLKCGGSSVVLKAGAIGITSSGPVAVTGSIVNLNSGSGPAAGAASLPAPKAPAVPEKPSEAGVVVAPSSGSGGASAGGGGGEVPGGGGSPGGGGGAATKDKPSFIGLELVDEAGKPVPGERFEVKLPEGSVVTGFLDDKGKAKVASAKEGEFEVSFPDLDKDEWKDA